MHAIARGKRGVRACQSHNKRSPEVYQSTYQSTSAKRSVNTTVRVVLSIEWRRAAYLRPAGFCCDLITFLTILASSTRKARRMLNVAGNPIST